MPSTFTQSLRVELQANGENETTWGEIANRNFRHLETAIAGRTDIAMNNADHVLTTQFGADDTARNMMLIATGALTAARNIICPAVSKMYVVRNNTSGGYSVTVKTATGTGVVIGAGETRLVMCDGTNVHAAGSGNDFTVSPDGVDTTPATWSVNGFFGVNRANNVDPANGVLAADGTTGSYIALYANGTLVGTIAVTAAGMTLNTPSTPLALATSNQVRQTIATNGTVSFANNISTLGNVTGVQGVFSSDVYGRSLTLVSTAPTIHLSDADGVNRTVVNNGGLAGFGLANGNWGLYNDASGNTVSAGNVQAYSDERKKKDWDALKPNFVQRLTQVKYGSYTATDCGERRVGVSAQSLQKLLPEAVTEQPDGYLSLAYGNAALVSCIELAKEVERLHKRLEYLEGKV